MKRTLIVLIFCLSIILSSCSIKNMDQKYDDPDYITSNQYQTVYHNRLEKGSKVSFKSFSGKELIDTIYSGDTKTIFIDQEITEGSFKIVMIKSNNEIIDLKNGSSEYKATDGTVRIVIIGNQAKGFYRITITD